MGHLTLGTLTTLALTLGLALPAQAEGMQPTQEQTYAQNRQNVRETEAFNLVSAAYRGEFEPEGIPSYYKLEEAYEAGEIDAETLVNRAIAAGELSPTAANDEAYVNAVRLHLSELETTNN
ncbi:hypothetical protein PCC7418_1807 [Halothece sp. PCC 7418]|uniref:hypothetical protein n=1 Tax=Halothece sp. (strain PCC 7418) TaxID=65093 RepID=UPI0002A085F3|nr:hypothetical protein [Halothece sp. PCC 7418]AFZ43976.1 hypothetical protein PCC7418_1807 [Halothece sp. PCC 7418]